MKEENEARLEEQTYVHVILTRKLKKELAEEAEAKQMPLATYIRMLLVDRKEKNN